MMSVATLRALDQVGEAMRLLGTIAEELTESNRLKKIELILMVDEFVEKSEEKEEISELIKGKS